MSKVKYLPFEEAREFVRNLGLNGKNEYTEWWKTNRPSNIPSTPNIVYKNNGWVSFGDWLGTGSVHSKDFLPFEEAREFVRGLGLKNTNEWSEWSKTKRPNNIPSTPDKVYKDCGWVSFGDWLGTGNVHNKDKQFLTFEEAREFVRNLGLSGKTAWNKWYKANRPSNIPADPYKAYKNSGWVSFGDWLGTGNVHNKDRQYLTFEKAREFVRNLGLKNHSEWNEWSKTKRPNNIPSTPNIVYKNCGWVSFGDWLGTGSVSNKDKQFLPFEEAREFVRGLGLKNTNEWNKWFKTNRPSNIPADPYTIYKDCGWVSLGDWLGTGIVSNKDRQFLSFEEAREFVRGLGLKNTNEWNEWFKTNRPSNIPAHPYKVYKDCGWVSFSDWIGNCYGQYLPFEEAREFARNLGLKNQSEWVEWFKTNRPSNIPSTPNMVYKNNGWCSWGDWLGTGSVSTATTHIERKASTKALINVMIDTCSEDADFLKPSILVTLSSVLKSFNKSNKFNKSLVNDLLRSNTSDVNEVLNEHLHELDDVVDDTYIDDTDDTDIDDVEDADIDLFDDTDDTDIDDVEDDTIDIFDDTDDDGMSVEQAQAELDRTATFFDNSLDVEGVDIDEVLADDNTRILIDGFVNHYAQVIINKTDLSCASVCKVPIVETFDSIKSYAQYTLARLMYEVATLKYPANDCGIAYNSMQLQFANGVLKNKYYGNWSGTGVGKTLSFILASRVIDSRLTVVICTNNTKHQIAREIENTYNDSMCYVYDGKLPSPYEIDYSKHNYMIFNYEKGQLENSSEIFDKLVDNYVIDYVVFDEVQLVKSTDCSSDSKRRELFVGFRNKCVKKYDSYISVLTATPITTCINEVSSIIELLTGVDYSASTNVRTTFEGCLVWHLIIFNFGCRDGKKPTNINGDTLKLNTNIVRLDASSEVSMMVRFSKAFSSQKPLNIAASTMYYKIDKSAKMGLFNKFTIIYTYFIGENILKDIKGALYNNGLDYAVYTGEEKSGLVYDNKGNVDWKTISSKYNVLIASDPIATGVDGLQKVCCNMVIACLPYTDKLYQQLVGRIYRQGSAFDVVDINILSVAFGEFHTYEDKLYNRIIRRHEFHKACVDGNIPMNDFNKHIIDVYRFNYDLEIETIREIVKAAQSI